MLPLALRGVRSSNISHKLVRDCFRKQHRFLSNFPSSSAVAEITLLPANAISSGINAPPSDVAPTAEMRVSILSSTSTDVKAEIKAKIETLLTAECYSTEAFDSFIHESLQKCRIEDVANLLRLSGVKNTHKTRLSLKKHLPAIAAHLELISGSKCRIVYASFIVYGLMSFKERTPGVTSILQTVRVRW
jgi:hypothetical protein